MDHNTFNAMALKPSITTILNLDADIALCFALYQNRRFRWGFLEFPLKNFESRGLPMKFVVETKHVFIKRVLQKTFYDIL